MPRSQPRSAREPLAPLWAIAGISWLNSIGSGVLWSGVPFVTEHDFGFTQAQNLWLNVAASAVYTGIALCSGRLVRLLTGWTSTRGVLLLVLGVEALAALLAFDGAAGVVACALLTSAVGATLWPIVESYLSSGRHGPAMRSAIGVFNIVWMSATAAALFLMAPLLDTGQARLALVGYGALALLSTAFLRWFPRTPAPHPPEAAEAHVPASYRPLLRSTRFLVPVSYLFLGALGPLMPYLTQRAGVTAHWETPLTAIWMLARLLAVIVLSRLAFWHGRWSTLGVATALLALGFAVVVLAPSVEVMALGLLVLGLGQGVIYYASLYYTMAVGQAAVEASAVFEALVGLGYVVGPLAALLGYALGGGVTGPATIGCVWIAAGLGLAPAVGTWWKGRRVP